MAQPICRVARHLGRKGYFSLYFVDFCDFPLAFITFLESSTFLFVFCSIFGNHPGFGLIFLDFGLVSDGSDEPVCPRVPGRPWDTPSVFFIDCYRCLGNLMIFIKFCPRRPREFSASARSDFGGFSEARWNQVGTLIGSKIDLILKALKGARIR